MDMRERGEDWAAEAEPILAEAQAGRFAKAAGLQIMTVWNRVLRVAASEGLTFSYPPELVTTLDGKSAPALAAAAAQLFRAMKDRGDQASIGLVMAFNASLCLTEMMRAIEGAPDSDPEILGKAAFHTFVLAKAAVALELWEAGLWSDHIEKTLKLKRMGAHLKGRIPSWEVDFLPLAKKYCTGKSKVTLGQLIHQVREARASKQISGIPDSDEGIRNGIKRMVARSELVIPGYSAPARPG